MEQDQPFIVGGDLNIILDNVLDGQGGNSKRRDSRKIAEDMSAELDLLDIWRIRNPTVTRFTWRQKKPIIQRRLDYWLVSYSLQDDINSVDIKSSIKSDHSAITLSINGLDDLEKGPNFRKFNSNLVNDSAYCELLTTEYANWLKEFKEVQDKRVLCDLIKYKIRQQTIRYSRTKARERRAKRKSLEEDLEECAEKCDSDPNTKNLEELECFQTEYDSMYDYITQRAIIRSRTTWYEFSERNNKYFLNPENANKKKSTVRKVFNREGKLTTDPKQIMNELEVFYADLYDGSTCVDMGSFPHF